MQLPSAFNVVLLATAASALPWDVLSNRAAAPEAVELKGTPISHDEEGTAIAARAAATSSANYYPSTVLYHHNLHRANHTSTGNMTYNTTLAGYAATLAATCNFHHDVTIGGGGYGQNIAAYGASGTSASQNASIFAARAITNAWYNGEINDFLSSYYGEATPDMSNFEAWGHYSQVVWKASNSVGCASQYCASGTIFSGLASWYTVCNYKSAGNVGGSYGTNIGKPLGKATVTAA